MSVEDAYRALDRYGLSDLSEDELEDEIDKTHEELVETGRRYGQDDPRHLQKHREYWALLTEYGRRRNDWVRMTQEQRPAGGVVAE